MHDDEAWPWTGFRGWCAGGGRWLTRRTEKPHLFSLSQTSCGEDEGVFSPNGGQFFSSGGQFLESKDGDMRLSFWCFFFFLFGKLYCKQVLEETSVKVTPRF